MTEVEGSAMQSFAEHGWLCCTIL